MRKMTKSLRSLNVVFLTAAILPSCALMIHGTKQEVRFNCTKDAEIKLNMNSIGRTNQLVVIPRKDLDGLVRISAPGCETKEMMLPLHTSPATWVDVLWSAVPYGSTFILWDYTYQSNVSTENEINIELNCK